ncbi:hypothetical protein CFAM422_007638 [Trichoderma lentiforme]|uniref:Extracellular membrane protein CFEM domain-containing protein n=1 Tax=Trichoderma lentiforme TaxID=1567552 RepID=A0A9P4XCH2_9HYPO|nr:hypothetical protein CFAM422_007638 [Trichoderma lentiforme]
MRPVSAAAVLAACLHVGLCDANDLAPRCAVNCASNIRNDKGALDLKTICGNKLMTNSLFQCLIGACPQNDYGPALAHVVLACSNLGMSIGPLHPVEVQHVDLEKPQYLPTPSIPPAYGTPGDASRPDTDHLTLSFDISLDLKCNSGPDGLVTVTLPPPTPSTPATSPTPPPPVSSPDPGEGEGEGEGENQGEGENGNGEDGNATPPAPAKPTKSTADPATTSSCPPGSTSPSSQGPDGGQAPPQSTDPSENGGPAVTSAPSAAPGGDNSSSPASTSPCSTASQDTGGLDPQDPNQSSNNSAGEPSHPPNGGDGPQAPATSVATPALVSPTPAPSSSPCSATDDANMSANPIPGPQVSKTAEPATVAQPSPLPSPSSPPAATSLVDPVPTSIIHSIPPPPLSSAEPADPSSANPPEYTPAVSGEQSPDNSSAFQTSIPESSAEPVPQESPSSGAQAPSYGQGGLSSPVQTPDSQTDDLAAETAESKPTSKTAEPSVTTLWPTAKTNRSSSPTSPGAHGQPSTTTCESGGKETVTTGHDEPMGSAMVKVIRPGEAGAETMFVTVWEPAPAATAASTDMISNVAQLAIGSSVMVESMVDSGHVAEPSSLPTQSGFVMSRPTTARVSVPFDNVVAETSLPKIALVNSVSKLTPQLCIIALLIILVSGILMS